MTPLYNALQQYAAMSYSSFHTPGHKISPEALLPSLLQLDFTELPQTDDLYSPTAAIAEAEALAAVYYGCDATLFCAGGCTLAVQTMMSLALRPGDRLALSRKVHKSVIHTMIALGIHPIWVSDNTADSIRTVLTANNDVKAVLLTSPDYFGRLADISSISETCHAFNIPLLVDNAHGTHLTTFDIHPINQGADICTDSAHKTTPALTGGAFLHILNKHSYSIKDAKGAMSFWGSSSPSFPILASLDLARDWMQSSGKAAYNNLAKKVELLRSEALSLGLEVVSGNLTDPARFTLINLDGNKAAKIFRSHKVEPEFADHHSVIFIPTPFNDEKDFERLRTGIYTLGIGGEASRHLHLSPSLATSQPIPYMIISPRQAVFSNTETLTLADAVGRVSAQLICPCPPGKAILVPGELICEEMLPVLHESNVTTIKVVINKEVSL